MLMLAWPKRLLDVAWTKHLSTIAPFIGSIVPNVSVTLRYRLFSGNYI